MVVTVFNVAQWLDEALESILLQSFTGTMEISIFNDASTDSTEDILKKWQGRFESAKIGMVVSSHSDHPPRGVGYGRNRAIQQSKGKHLCFFDGDDVMAPRRIERQHAAVTAAGADNMLLLGSSFIRTPANSTHRYSEWYHSLNPDQLHTQALTAFGPTLIQPTWFCSRRLFDRVGTFSEQGKGTPEDLIFFYRHLALGGQLQRVDEELLTYRYHEECQSFSVKRETIWSLRVEALESRVLPKWSHFTVWNAGKQGRRLYRSLRPENQAKVVAFCDVDQKKIHRGFYTYEESKSTPKPKVPICHFSCASPPFILCVKLGLTGGEFEKNLASLQLKEGVDYYHFS